MNISLKTAGGHIVVRPDTTWKKNYEDAYMPPFVSAVSYTPVIFARISKAGKSVGKTFAWRYYDGVGYGILLYADDLEDGSPEGFASASCLDNTSFLPLPLYQSVVLDRKGNYFSLKKNGIEIFSTDCGTKDMVENAIAETSVRINLRTGDFVAVELAPRRSLCSREEGSAMIEGTYCENFLLEFKIVF